MAIDLRQFHQTFFEESLEGVAEMESELLRIEAAGTGGRRGTDSFEADREALNTIFRAAHSIKGGASTFGFTAISDFAHVLETVLDDLREGHIEKNRRVLTALMRSVDCLRALLFGARDGTPVDTALVSSVRETLEAVHEDGGGGSADRRKSGRAAPAPQVSETGWRIDFRPHPNLFLTGNDPVRIFRELTVLGTLRATASTAGLPAWSALDPASCYLSWVLELEGRIAREAVTEVFSWVESDCDLRIEPMESERPEAAARAADGGASAGGAQQSIRVSLPKIDALVDLVGELVITQTMLSRYQSGFDPRDLSKLQDALGQLERNTRDLQESVMRIRMLPVGFAFNRLPRIVHDLGQQLGKKVDLRIFGEQTELDKTVIERIGDPLMHLVRNCMDHGIETPAERKAAGKSEVAVLRVEAYQKSGNVYIEIEDDGRGLMRDKILAKAIERGLVARDAVLTPEQINDLIFLPGFSTAVSVTGVSGRGVGMDVVRSNMQALGGSVELFTREGVGTRFTLRLPLTLAIIDGLIMQVGTQTYIAPLLSVVESLSLARERISRPAGGTEVFDYHGGEVLPVLRLHEVFGVAGAVTDISRGIVVVVEIEGRKIGMLVDQLIGQQQVVVKSLESHYRRVDGVAAATILGDGEVVLVLDIATLVRLAGERRAAA
jgi:two-component system chemotaxis sensor kinase CheA